MKSAAKFIDFFVHDILDYTMINKKEAAFAKFASPFNLKEAI